MYRFFFKSIHNASLPESKTTSFHPGCCDNDFFSPDQTQTQHLLPTYLVVDVTVGEHGVKVLHGLTGAPIVIVLQTLLDGAHVHWVLDHLVVILKDASDTYSLAIQRRNNSE